MFNLTFSKILDDDIDSCYFYIKDNLQAPMAAENLMKELYVKIDKVLENPFFRPLVQDKLLASLGIRSIGIKNYLLFYNVEEDINNINFITFMYGKRDWANIIKELPLNEII